jgi:acetylglutamate kinase
MCYIESTLRMFGDVKRFVAAVVLACAGGVGRVVTFTGTEPGTVTLALGTAFRARA